MSECVSVCVCVCVVSDRVMAIDSDVVAAMDLDQGTATDRTAAIDLVTVK